MNKNKGDEKMKYQCSCGGNGIDHAKDCKAWKYLPNRQDREKWPNIIKRYV